MIMKYLFFLLLIFSVVALHAQQPDSVVQKKNPVVLKKDSTKKKLAIFKKDSANIHSPKKATIRSAIIPGWGQAYNKKYWKIPIVYGALGTAAGFFFYNRKEYSDARDAYRYKVDTIPSNDIFIKPKFQPVDPEAIRQYRNSIRQYVDYSVLAFLILWGLNVVDATVDGHLKAFEVSENLSLKINPGYIPQTKQGSISLLLTFGKNTHSSSK